MEKEMTLGSLFDGIAGFPLAAAQNGIKTIWATVSKTLERTRKQLKAYLTERGFEI